MTSNIGVKELNEFGPSVGFKTTSNILSEETRVTDVIHKALKKKFKPEFLNRISETIIFNPLSEENINSIIYNELAKLQSRLVEMGYKLNVEPEAVKYVAHEGYDQVYGARPLNRAIEHLIEDPIADEILNGNIKDGSTITVKLKDGVIFITNDNPKPKKKPTKKDVI
jgi:ATP-dependent Clp protease ATP-binding subunit ClpC